MSSASISPRAFYRERSYGYHTWYTLSDKELNNAIVLFDKPFSFSRPKSDLEDHPLLIEVQTEENFPEVQEGIFLCDHTIYLSPWRTKFILFTKADKNTMLSMEVGSLETKMSGLYSKEIVVETYETGSFPESLEDVPLNRGALENDMLTNQLKGLLYGYYIGSMLSAPMNLVRRYKCLRELNNIFSSIVSSGDKKATKHQEARLSEIIQEVNKDSPLVKEWGSINGMTSPMLDEVIKTALNFGAKLPGVLGAGEIITDIATNGSKGSSFTWLGNQMKTLDEEIKRSSMVIKDVDEEIIICDGKLSRIKAAGNEELVKAWINEVIAGKEYQRESQEYIYSLSDELTNKAKDVFGYNWDKSPMRNRLNHMRRFVRGSEGIKDWSNDDTSSIAAVLFKGGEWNILLDFMRCNEMNDCRLAFAFYGMLHGFANLTRDFTDILLGHNDKQYVADIVREIDGQLLGDNFGDTGSADGVSPPKKGADKNTKISGTQRDTTTNDYIAEDKQMPLIKLGMWQEKNWIEKTAKFVKEPKSKKQYEKDAEWFFNNYQDNFYNESNTKNYEGQYRNNKKDNASVIEHFERYLLGKNKGEGSQAWLQEPYKYIPIDKIIGQLKEDYNE